MKILITRVTGFVGGYFLRILGENKRDRPSLQLIATARRSELAPEVAQWADQYFAADLSEGCPPITATVCIHAAGLADDRSTAFISAYVAINETIRLRGALSRQSLGYLTESCVLDCTTTRDTLNYIPSETFFDHVSAIGQAVARGRT